ncbi:hypothetical protein EB74_11620 [Mycobacterium sp. SWH-M5]|nr:hypothetical protein EB74_11620 [Mycobacterium sp. SWH-M5]
MWANTEHHRCWWIAGGAGALLVIAVFLYGLGSMIGSVVNWIGSDPNKPDVLTQVNQHDNDAGLVSLFVKHCTELWAKATPDTAGSLQECVTLPPKARNSFSSTAAEVSGIDVYPPQETYRDADLSMWSVLVAATVKEFTASTATRQFVWWSVSLPRTGGPRATMLPDTRATSLPSGVDMELAYNFEVRGSNPSACMGASSTTNQPSTPLYDVVKGFTKAYLCGPAQDIGNYVTPDSQLAGLGQLYSDVVIDSVRADAAVDGPPLPGEQVRVLLTVTGKEATGGQKPMQYPLLVVESGGRWAVAALEDLPAITGRVLAPGS